MNRCIRNKTPRREKKSTHKFKKRAGFTDSHHLNPEERGGKKILVNLLRMDAYRHDAWHLLFENLTLEEVRELLLRVKKAKEAQKS